MNTQKTQVKKVLHMFGAQTYGTAVNMIDKLATVPLFLFFWGLELYGEWLILRAIPAYFAIAELGFSSAAANEMSVLILKDKYKEANKYFQSTFLLLLIITVVTLGAVALVVANIDIKSIFNFNIDNDYSILFVILLMLAYTLLIFQTQLLSAAYRAVGQYVKGAYITYNIRVFELIGVVVALYFNVGLLGVAFTYFITRLIGAIIMAIILLKNNEWLTIGIKEASIAIIRKMLPNASGFLAFPLGQAINLQGILFIVANISSPAVVAIFSTSRTLARVITQLGMQVNRSVWPELTRLVAENLKEQAAKLYLNAFCGFIYIGGGASLLLIIFTPYIFSTWTGGKIEPDLTLFSLLLVSSLFNGLWFSALSILSATNTHKKVSLIYLLFNILIIFLAYIFNDYLHVNLIAWSLLVSEFILLLVIVNASLKQLNVPKLMLFKHMYLLPITTCRTIISKG